MKKCFSLMLLCITLMLSASGLAEHFVSPISPDPDSTRRMVPLFDDVIASSVKVYIFYDKETRVMYMISRQGDIQVLLDQSGCPVLYEEKENFYGQT